jgi:paraquat-inducible protein B
MLKTMNNKTSITTAKIEKKHLISSIWFLPFVAALLGGWILIQHIIHANAEITIHFANADSIIVDKTKVRYKGVIIGTVKRIELDEESGVNIIAEIESHATFMLREKTTFWLVSPKASLTSISGLDTLFSGSYINLQPGGGESSRDFNALTEQPIYIPEDALLINLESKTADSISVGTPIFFKKIKVGEVAQIRLDEEEQKINIKVFIENRYSYLIKEDSKFWNISGLQANISRAGIDFKIDSISSLIAGGITFSSPQGSPSTTTKAPFKLFADISKSEMGMAIELTFNDITNLPKGAGILFKGHGIGRITNIRYSTEEKQFIAHAVINPQFSDMITEGAQFWLEKTTVSFSKITNLGNIISGDYIAFLPDSSTSTDKKKATRFPVLQTQKPSRPMLTLKLRCEDASGLNPGDPVSYQGIKIGHVQQLDFSDNGRFIELLINIDHSYQYLINKSSQFYLLNGMKIKASLKGIQVQTLPVENIISGGIALYNAQPIKKSTQAITLDEKQIYRLYPSKEMAKLGKNVFSKPLTISLLSKELPSVNEGSPVYYHKFPIGEVSSFSIDSSSLIRTDLQIKGQYKHLINDNSVFWNISGFNIDAGLSGIKVQADSLLSIANGGIAVEFGSDKISNRFTNGLYKLFDSYQQAMQQPQKIKILFEQAYDLQVGCKLRLKGLVVGEITDLTLNQENKVEAVAELQPQFAKQIARQNSRFWIVRSEISLAGAKNLSTLISGVYLNVVPGNGNYTTKFDGEASAPAIALDKIGLPLILMADNAGSTDIGSPVYHRQIQIGEVTGKQLSSDASGVEIAINIYPQYSHLIRENSTFWPASGFNLDIGITGAVLKSTSLTSLVKGGISMSTTDKQALQPASKAYSRFTLKPEMQDEWLEWKLAIPKT